MYEVTVCSLLSSLPVVHMCHVVMHVCAALLTTMCACGLLIMVGIMSVQGPSCVPVRILFTSSCDLDSLLCRLLGSTVATLMDGIMLYSYCVVCVEVLRQQCIVVVLNTCFEVRS